MNSDADTVEQTKTVNLPNNAVGFEQLTRY